MKYKLAKSLYYLAILYSVLIIQVYCKLYISPYVFYRLNENEYCLHLEDETIQAANSYKSLISSIEALRSIDVLYVYLRGYGGDLEGAVELNKAFNTTKAKVVKITTGDVGSSHAILSCSSTTQYEPNSYIIMHMFSTVYSGNAGLVQKELHNNILWYLNYLATNCPNLMSQELIDNMMAGYDVIVPIPKTN